MAVPDYQTLMLPVLRRVAERGQPVAVRDFWESIADEFGLTPDEREERIPSGQENLLANRMAWARTYMGKAGLLVSPKRGLVEITPEGKALLAEGHGRIDNNTLQRFPEFVAWLTGSRGGPSTSAPEIPTDPAPQRPAFASVPLRVEPTPRESIEQANRQLESALMDEVLERVRRMTPGDFEGLIIKLLIAMGYGQGHEELATAIGGTGDGGMDGVIHQDPLGLDRVYIQAKRWKEGNNVSSPEIRNFVGALNIHRATKGVFVTASQFTSEARNAAKGSTVQVVLVDGARLAELMVRHKVGVVVRDTIEVKAVDEGFFGE